MRTARARSSRAMLVTGAVTASGLALGGCLSTPPGDGSPPGEDSPPAAVSPPGAASPPSDASPPSETSPPGETTSPSPSPGDPGTGPGGSEDPISPGAGTSAYDGSLEPRFVDTWGQLAPGTGEGDVYVVSPSGSDGAAGTADEPWQTIGHAVSADSPVGPGDVVEVQPGTYTEVVDVEVSGSADNGHLTLRASGDVTVVDPTPDEGFFGDGVIDTNGQSHLVVEGFRIEDASWAGIALRDARHVVVRDNETVNTGSSGIIALPMSYFDGGEDEVTGADVVVTGNRIERAHQYYAGTGSVNSQDRGGQEALTIWGVDGCEVSHNTVTEFNREGIDLKTGTRNCAVHHNAVSRGALVSGTPASYQGGPGIYLDGNRAQMSSIDVYANRVFDNQSEGISVADEHETGDVADVRVFDNLVHGNGEQGVNSGAGLYVGSNVRDLVAVGNTFTANVQAIVVDSRSTVFQGARTTGVTLTANVAARNTYRQVVLAASDVTMTGNVVEGDGLDGQPFVTAGTDADVDATGNVVRPAGDRDWVADPLDPETGAGVPATVTIGPRP